MAVRHMDTKSTDHARPDEAPKSHAGKGMTSTERAAWRAARRRSRKRILVLVGVGLLVCGSLYLWWSEENKPSKLGKGAFDEGRYDEAIKHFTRALNDNPKDAIAYADRAQAYRKKGDLGRSLADGNHAIRLAPDLGIGYVAKANTLTALGLAPKALEVL